MGTFRTPAAALCGEVNESLLFKALEALDHDRGWSSAVRAAERGSCALSEVVRARRFAFAEPPAEVFVVAFVRWTTGAFRVEVARHVSALT